MAQELICRPILLRDIGFSIFINWRKLKKKTIPLIFMGEGLNYLKFIQI